MLEPMLRADEPSTSPSCIIHNIFNSVTITSNILFLIVTSSIIMVTNIIVLIIITVSLRGLTSVLKLTCSLLKAASTLQCT